MLSTLFISQITTIDYAYVHPIRYTIEGGSLNLNAEITGNIEPIENVVVDFGTIKKSIKQFIDDKEYGFDHKLWVPENHNKKNGFENHSFNDSSNKISMYPFTGGNKIYVVSTQKFTLICPKNAIKVCDVSSIAETIQLYLEDRLYNEYPESEFKIKVSLTDQPSLPLGISNGYEVPFTYVHGLKKSSSWGCQNIAHGHKSWLLFVNDKGEALPVPDDFKLKISLFLDERLFIWKENVIGNDHVGLTLGYETSRGMFYLCIKGEESKFPKFHLIDTETTVEHLAEWFVKYFAEDIEKMVKLGASYVYFSEGLVKGSRVSLK